MGAKNLFTSREVASLLGVSMARVAQLRRQHNTGRLLDKRTWAFSPAEVEAMRPERKAGRPKKARREGPKRKVGRPKRASPEE